MVASNLDVLCSTHVGSDMSVVSDVASLQILNYWIGRHRFTQFYGEDYARLGRSQYRLEKPPVRSRALTVLSSALLFGRPNVIRTQMDRLFIDRLVYVIHWRKWIMSVQQSWTESAYLVKTGNICPQSTSLTLIIYPVHRTSRVRPILASPARCCLTEYFQG